MQNLRAYMGTLRPRLESIPAPAALAALFGLALALRLIGIGTESIWYDEAVSLRVVSSPYADLLSGVARDNGNPWGYWVLLKTWLSAFGPGIESARACSAVLGALVVPATFCLARLDGLGVRAALLGASLTAFSPPLVFLGREARVYAVFAVAATVAGAAARAVRDQHRSAYFPFACCGVILVYLHYYAFFILASLAVAILWDRWRDRGTWARLGLVGAIDAIAFVPLLPLFLTQLRTGAVRSEATWLLHAGLFPLHNLVGSTLVWKRDGLVPLCATFAVITLGIWLPAASGLIMERRVPVVSSCLTVGTFALAFLVSLRSPILTTRYLSVTIPAAMIVLVAGLGHLAKSRPRLSQLAGSLAGLLICASLVRLFAELHKPDWRGVAAFVADTAPGLPLFFYDDTGSLPYAYYRPNDSRHPITARFNAVTWDTDSVVGSMRAQQQGFWLIIYLPYSSPPDVDAVVKEVSSHFRLQRSTERLGVHALLFRSKTQSVTGEGVDHSAEGF